MELHLNTEPLSSWRNPDNYILNIVVYNDHTNTIIYDLLSLLVKKLDSLNILCKGTIINMIVLKEVYRMRMYGLQPGRLWDSFEMALGCQSKVIYKHLIVLISY